MKQIEIQHKTFRLKNDDRTFFCTEAKVDYNLNVLGISYVPVRNNMLPSDWEDSSVWLHLPNARLKDVIVIEDAQGLSGAYIPASKLEKGFSLQVNTPDSMDESTAEALKQLKNAVGDVAEFVAERLHYSLQELSECLALEQIDAVALAIYNVEARNQGLIVGDQTGIGKGRVASAFIRYGVVNGYKPIFFTEKPGLFSDIYRDLCDLHCETYRPFIINKDGGNVMNADGWDVFKHEDKDYKDAISTGMLPDKYDYICCTYSQVSSSSESSKEKLEFIAKMAKDNIVVLDESHNAGGEVKANSEGELTGGFTAFFFQTEVLCKCKGVLYLSATYAKKPENMPIYALNTCISDLDERGLSKEKLKDLSPNQIANSLNNISRYFISVPAQEIISSSMSRFGQFIRRERETKGMKVDYYTLDNNIASLEEGFQDLKAEHWAIYKNITEIYDRIRNFQEVYFLPYLQRKAQILASQGKRGQKPPTVASASLFSSLFHLTNNILLSIKALPVAERAIKHIKEGRKVVIALADTNESVLKNRKDAGRDNSNESEDAMTAIEVSEGQTINGDYTFTFDNIFRNLFYYQVRKGRKVIDKVDIEIEELGADAVDEYKAILDLFRTTTSGLCFSPIDVIKERIERENYSIAECTGRSLCLQFKNGDYRRSTIQKVEKYSSQQGRHVSLCYKKFNDNEVDVLIINQSGSTGKSAHATNKGTKLKPEEVKQRVMLIAQAELDVNTEVQKRGRINRTGQFEHIPPMYEYIFSAIPCEKRFMMMLKSKLKSLDANTTANQKQSNDSVLKTDDFFNKYGNDIVRDMLMSDWDLNHKLNDPLAIEPDPINPKRKKQKVENMALTCFGRMQVLSPEEQEKCYNYVLTQYNAKVEELKMADEFDLEIKNADFQAKKISENVLTINNNDGTRSELVGNSFITRYSIKSQTKYTSLKDLTDMVNRNTQSGLGATDEILKRLKTDYETIVKGEKERHADRLKSDIEEQERKVENINRTIDDLVEDGGSQDSIDRQREKRKLAVEKLNALKSGKDEEFDEKMSRRKEQYDLLRGLIDKMRIGEFFEYESNIFCVTQISISNGNGDTNIFSAPSNILVSFITTDPLNLRGVSHNFAQNGCEFMTKLSEKKSSARAYDAYVKNDTRREEVSIITGNIVKYLGQAEGKIVITRYTLEDGTMENGIVVKPVLKNGELEYPDWARYTQVPMTEKTIKPVMLSLTSESMCPLTSNQFVGGLRLRGQRRGDDMGFYIDADRGYGEFLSQPDVYSCFAYEPRWNGTYNTEVSNIKKFLSILTREEYGFMVQVHLSNLSAYSDAIGLEKYKPADWQKLSYNKSSIKKKYCGNLLRAEIAVRRVNSMVDEANKGKKPSSKSKERKPSNEEQPSGQPIFVHDYSEKAWAVTGGGKREWDILRGEGAKFNKNLSVGKGWVLPKAKFTKAEILKLVA